MASKPALPPTVSSLGGLRARTQRRMWANASDAVPRAVCTSSKARCGSLSRIRSANSRLSTTRVS